MGKTCKKGTNELLPNSTDWHTYKRFKASKFLKAPTGMR